MTSWQLCAVLVLGLAVVPAVFLAVFWPNDVYLKRIVLAACLARFEKITALRGER